MKLVKAIYDLIHAIVTRDRLLRQIRDNLQSNHEETLHIMSEILDAVAAAEAGQAELKNDIAAIKTDVAAVLALLQQPNPDVAEAIRRLEAIAADQTATDAEADAVDADLKGAIPPA